MVTVNREHAPLIAELIRLSEEAFAATLEASEREQDSDFRDVLLDYARERERAVSELKGVASRLGLDLADEAVKRRVEDEGPLVDRTADAGGETLARAYQEALERDLPGELRDVLERQAIQAEEAHEHLVELQSGALSRREADSDSPPEKPGEDDEVPRDLRPDAVRDAKLNEL